MKSKSIFLFITLSVLTVYGTWSVVENSYESSRESLKDVTELQASLVEYSNIAKQLYSDTSGLIEVRSEKITSEVSLSGVDKSLSSFYYWLKGKNISFAGSIAKIYEDLKSVNNKNDIDRIKNILPSYQVKLIARGVKEFNDREYIRKKIDSIISQLDRVSFQKNVKAEKSLEQKTILQRIEDNLKRIKSLKKYIIAQSSKMLNIEGTKIEIYTIFTLAISFLLSLLFTILTKKSEITTVNKQIENVKNENTEEDSKPIVQREVSEVNNIKATFTHTKYPVLICTKSYQILWGNNLAATFRMNQITLKQIVQSLQTGKAGLNVVEFRKKFYHFSLNAIKINNELKTYLVQLIPTERPIIGHNTIIDKTILSPIQKAVSKSKKETYELNTMFSNLLIKTNFIFQLTGITIEFLPIKESTTCVVDKILLEKSLKSLLVEIYSFIKDNKKIKKIAIELSQIEGRLFFNFVIPSLNFAGESFNSSHTKSNFSAERFLKKLDEIECSLAIARSRIVLRNVQIKDNGEIVSAANISFSVENRDIKDVFRSNNTFSNGKNKILQV